ncbi:MAG: hypothetical protein K1060chlam4_00782 [Candidatus Anoxychlamydiales bacterium]|nr:hypothetical protein [Candidatus Anoxychlamydiales bacterium]
MYDENLSSKSQILFYQTEDGNQRIEVRLEKGMVWLSQKLIAELFGIRVNTVNYHIQEIYKSKELYPEATIRKYRIVQKEGNRKISRNIEFYNLEVIIAIGYRVQAHRGTQFRIWATNRLNEYLVKGFILDDERLSKPGEIDYFDELLERIRHIRISEKRFYQKIRDIYTLSADYDSEHPMTQEFFKAVQNKLLYAITGLTAAELIHRRAGASQPHMGLMTWDGVNRGKKLSKKDVIIAKNYLKKHEISSLELLVSQYLDFAEFQTRRRKVMYMANWKEKLDGFLKLNEQDILTHAGKISSKLAKEVSEAEYEKFEEHENIKEIIASEEALQEAVLRLSANKETK